MRKMDPARLGKIELEEARHLGARHADLESVDQLLVGFVFVGIFALMQLGAARLVALIAHDRRNEAAIVQDFGDEPAAQVPRTCWAMAHAGLPVALLFDLIEFALVVAAAGADLFPLFITAELPNPAVEETQGQARAVDHLEAAVVIPA